MKFRKPTLEEMYVTAFLIAGVASMIYLTIKIIQWIF